MESEFDTRSIELIERFCDQPSLVTDDPYDVWKTGIGFRIKDLYNRHRLVGLLPAAVLTIFDLYINNRCRYGYKPQEYPIVRAMASTAMCRVYESTGRRSALDRAKEHLDWLMRNSCSGYRGRGWGLAFNYAVGPGIIYGPNTPFSTMTPYVVDAILEFRRVSSERVFESELKQILTFFDEDIVVMRDDALGLATSYVPWPDRIVINSVSYTMAMLAVLSEFSDVDDRQRIREKVVAMFHYISNRQESSGAWYYSESPGSFVDCFHTCITIKNLIKAGRMIRLAGLDEIVDSAVTYLDTQLWDAEQNLYRRFSVANKPGLVRFDLYDNAEAASLLFNLGRPEDSRKLIDTISSVFERENDIYSILLRTGQLRNRNNLRWAVMPLLLARSNFLLRDEVTG